MKKADYFLIKSFNGTKVYSFYHLREQALNKKTVTIETAKAYGTEGV